MIRLIKILVDAVLEVFFVSQETTKQIMVSLPEELLHELDCLKDKHNTDDPGEIIYQATRMYVKEHKKQQIRETMEQGYMEMAKINLTIAAESFLAEEEAENTLDRLVSGV